MNNKNMAVKLNHRCRIADKMLLHKKVQNVSFLETFRGGGRNDVISSKTKG